MTGRKGLRPIALWAPPKAGRKICRVSVRNTDIYNLPKAGGNMLARFARSPAKGGEKIYEEFLINILTTRHRREGIVPDSIRILKIEKVQAFGHLALGLLPRQRWEGILVYL